MINFLYDFGRLEYMIIAGFLLVYLLYFLRLFLVVKRVKKNILKLSVKFLLRLTAFTLLLIALLGPYKKELNGDQDLKVVSKDIFIAIDLSLSMNANDVVPSRLARVKHELHKLIEAFKGENIGLIIFSSQAYLQSPLTYDHNYLKTMLDGVSSSLVPSSGTDFYHPLRMAMGKHEVNEDVDNNSKVIVLISDGEDHGEQSDDVVEELKDKNIKLFTLGVGTKQGGKIPTGRGFKKDDSGKEVVTKLKASALKQLARKTNGKYFELSDKRNDIYKLIQEIKEIKGESRDTRRVSKPKDLRYEWFLVAAIILLLIDFITGIKVLKV